MEIDKVLKENAFLSMHPLIQPIPKELITLPSIMRQYQGYISAMVKFAAYNDETVSIEEEISISIPSGYPINLPYVFVLSHGNVVNLGAEYHFYTDTGQLCLGNSWEVRKKLLHDPTLNNLMTSLIIPHIAGATFKLLHGSAFPQGEYAHGIDGKLEGLASFFSISKDVGVILNILSFLSQSKRVANKVQCPFGCGKEYKECHCKGDFQDLKILFPQKEISAILNEINIAKIRVLANHNLRD